MGAGRGVRDQEELLDQAMQQSWEADDMYEEEPCLPDGNPGKPQGALGGRFKMRAMTEPIGVNPAVTEEGWNRAVDSRVRLLGGPLGSALMNGPAPVQTPKGAKVQAAKKADAEDDEDDDQESPMYRPSMKRRGT